MPRYNYLCKDCDEKANKQFGEDITQEQFEEHVLFETSHAMEPSEAELAEAKKCPRCGGTDCEICIYGTEIHSYIRGYGWLDKNGIRRDMNLFKLTSDDPYAKYRVAGEVDDMAQKLRNAGKHESKPTHFVQNDKAMAATVEKVVRSKPNTDQK